MTGIKGLQPHADQTSPQITTAAIKAQAYDRLCPAVAALLENLEPEHKDRLLSSLSAEHHVMLEKAVIVARETS